MAMCVIDAEFRSVWFRERFVNCLITMHLAEHKTYPSSLLGVLNQCSGTLIFIEPRTVFVLLSKVCHDLQKF